MFSPICKKNLVIREDSGTNCCGEEQGNPSLYDVSDGAINRFAYNFIKTPQEVLKIFKLNTELYPDGFNTFDSYGECLLLLNKKEEAKVAYKKSLELNPKNNNALQKLKELWFFNVVKQQLTLLAVAQLNT